MVPRLLRALRMVVLAGFWVGGHENIATILHIGHHTDLRDIHVAGFDEGCQIS